MGPGLFPSRYVSIHSGGRGVVERVWLCTCASLLAFSAEASRFNRRNKKGAMLVMPATVCLFFFGKRKEGKNLELGTQSSKLKNMSFAERYHTPHENEKKSRIPGFEVS